VWGLIGRVNPAAMRWPEVIGALGLGVASGAAVLAIGARVWGMAELRWLIRGRTQTDGGTDAEAAERIESGAGSSDDRGE